LRNANEELLAYEGELRALAERVAELRCPVIVIHGTALDGQGHGLPWTAQETIWKWVLALAN